MLAKFYAQWWYGLSSLDKYVKCCTVKRFLWKGVRMELKLQTPVDPHRYGRMFKQMYLFETLDIVNFACWYFCCLLPKQQCSPSDCAKLGKPSEDKNLSLYFTHCTNDGNKISSACPKYSFWCHHSEQIVLGILALVPWHFLHFGNESDLTTNYLFQTGIKGIYIIYIKNLILNFKFPSVLPETSERKVDKYTKWPPITTRIVLPPGNNVHTKKQGTKSTLLWKV